MEMKKLARLLQLALIGAAVLGIAVFGIFVPEVGLRTAEANSIIASPCAADTIREAFVAMRDWWLMIFKIAVSIS